MKTYAIYLTTCSKCYTSNVIARRPRGYRLGPKCECGAQLGPMQYMLADYVKAEGQMQAVEKYDKQDIRIRREKLGSCLKPCHAW